MMRGRLESRNDQNAKRRRLNLEESQTSQNGKQKRNSFSSFSYGGIKKTGY